MSEIVVEKSRTFPSSIDADLCKNGKYFNVPQQIVIFRNFSKIFELSSDTLKF